MTRNSQVFSDSPRRIVGEVVGDDWHYAARMAEALGTDHHAYRLSVEPMLEAIDQMIWHREKPLVTLSEYGHHCLSREAARTVKVLLSGQGADELFGGYYYWFQFREAATTPFFPWVSRTDPADAAYPSTRFDWFAHLLTDDARQTMPFEAHKTTFDTLLARADTPDFFNKISYLLLKTHLHEMLELEDRHGMTHSVEMRVPFLDHRLAVWALNLPAALKASRHEEKALLRRMAEVHLPEFPRDVLARKKSPMPPPFDIGALVPAMLDALIQPHLAIEDYFDRARLRSFVRGFDRSRLDAIGQQHYVLFTLYFLERWHHLFDRTQPVAPLADRPHDPCVARWTPPRSRRSRPRRPRTPSRSSFRAKRSPTRRSTRRWMKPPGPSAPEASAKAAPSPCACRTAPASSPCCSASGGSGPSS